MSQPFTSPVADLSHKPEH